MSLIEIDIVLREAIGCTDISYMSIDIQVYKYISIDSDWLNRIGR